MLELVGDSQTGPFLLRLLCSPGISLGIPSTSSTKGCKELRVLTVLAKPRAAAPSQSLKAQKAPARGLVWGCPAAGEGWGQGWMLWDPKQSPRGLCLGCGAGACAWVQLQTCAPGFVSHGPAWLFPERSVKWKTNGEGRKKKKEKEKKGKKQTSTPKQNRSAWVNTSRRREGEKEKSHKHPPHPSSCLQYLFTPNRLIRIQGWPQGKNKG